jgi:formylglycine-generating enzyme required for sulfatase activity
MTPATVEAPPGMVLVPAGPFLFGTELRELVIDAFFCDRDPVTNTEFDAFLRATGHTPPQNWPFGRMTPEVGVLPVNMVSFADARAYAAWARKELPTEAQWEKAARGTDGRKYPWGARFDAFRTNTRESARGRLIAVTELTDESPYGCRGMSGNVYQWTRSYFNKAKQTRVIKGGCFRDYLGSVAWRHEQTADRPREVVGLRCVKRLAVPADGATNGST